MKRIALAVIAALVSAPALAGVVVKDAWIRATVPHQKTTGAFMQIVSDRDARLVGARCPLAGTVELHEMTMTDNMMRMRAVDGIDLPAGRTVTLKPGGFHVMLFDLRRPIHAGDTVPLSIVVEMPDKSRETIEVEAHAVPLGASHAHGMHDH
ncbi:MAG: copper chaperone PCu(A)C [Betaproteobacteria bacterium]|nr:copper chaperone PCu(A)C [Betaproteobacteria bacterium]